MAQLADYSVQFFFCGTDDEVDYEPDCKVGGSEYEREYEPYVPFKGNPGINPIAKRISRIERQKVAEEGSSHGPMLDLVKHACSRLDESQQIGGDDCCEKLSTCEREIFKGEGQDVENDPRNNGAKTAEQEPPMKKILSVVFHYLIPNLSFTVFS